MSLGLALAAKCGFSSRWLARGRLGCLAVAFACAVGLSATGHLRAAAWGLLTFVITLAGAALLRGARDRSFALDLALVALTLRWVCVALLQLVLAARGHSHFVFPDESGYQRAAIELSRFWLGNGPSVPAVDHHFLGAFATVVAGALTAGGYTVFAGLTVPVAFGTWTAVLAHRVVAESVYPSEISAARIAGVLAALYPTTLAWSCLLLKDSSVACATMAVVVGVLAVRGNAVRRRWRVASLVLPIAGGAWLVSERAGQVAPIGFAISIWALWLLARTPFRFRLLSVAIVACVFAALALTAILRSGPDHIPRTLASHRAFGRLEAKTASVAEAPPREATWGSTAAYLPRGLSLVLIRPLPWAAKNTAQRGGVVGNILYLLLCTIAGAGAALTWRQGRQEETALLIGVVVAVWVLLALAEGNAGTAFRHRDAVTPLLLCFAGVALASARVRFADRRGFEGASRQLRHATAAHPTDEQ